MDTGQLKKSIHVSPDAAGVLSVIIDGMGLHCYEQDGKVFLTEKPPIEDADFEIIEPKQLSEDLQNKDDGES